MEVLVTLPCFKTWGMRNPSFGRMGMDWLIPMMLVNEWLMVGAWILVVDDWKHQPLIVH